MSNAVTSAGTKIYIGDALPATYDKAGFEALTWTEIGEVTDLGEFGREYNLVTHNPVGDRRTVKRKGSFNDGSTTIQYAFDRSTGEEGQAALRTAVDDDTSQSIKIELPDAEETHIYFSAQVMSAPINVGSVDQILAQSTTLEIDNDVLFEDAPTP